MADDREHREMLRAAPRAPLHRLLSHARPHLRVLLVGGSLTLAGGAVGLAQPLAARYVIDALGAGGPLLAPVLLLAAAVVVGALIGALGSFLLERTGQGVVLDVRRGLAGSLVRLRVAEVDRLTPGDLVARLTADTTLLRTVTTSGLTDLVTGAVLLVGGIAVMAVLDPVLLLVTLGMILVVGVLMALVLPRIGRATQEAQAALGAMGGRLERVFGAFRTVKASSAEDTELARLDEAAVDSWRKGSRSRAGARCRAPSPDWPSTSPSWWCWRWAAAGWRRAPWRSPPSSRSCCCSST